LKLGGGGRETRGAQTVTEINGREAGKGGDCDEGGEKDGRTDLNGLGGLRPESNSKRKNKRQKGEM